MGTPITWRNVDAPDPARAAAPMVAAGDSVNRAFDIFNRVIQQRQGVDDANFAAADEGAKQAYLGRLQQFKTPEEVAAFEASPEAAALKQSLTAASRAQTLGAGEARLAATRQGVVAENAYGDSMLNREQLPIREQIAALTSTGKFAEARALATSTPNLQGMGVLMNGITTAERAALNQANANAATRDATRLRTLNLTEAERKAAAADQAVVDGGYEKSLIEQATREGSAYQQRVGLARAQVASVASNLGYSNLLRPDGSLDTNKVDDKTRVALNAELKRRDMPSLESTEQGDTAAAASFLASIRNTGVYKPEMVAKVEGMLPKLFSSTRAPEIGVDAESTARNARALDALAAENEMKFGVVATPKTMAGLSDAATAVINEVTKEGSWRREAFREVVAKFLQTDGITAGDQRVIPSAETLKQIIRGASNGFTGTNTAEIKAALEAWKTRTESLQGAQEAVRLRNVQTLRTVNTPPPR